MSRNYLGVEYRYGSAAFADFHLIAADQIQTNVNFFHC
jgi:hypothetical protein